MNQGIYAIGSATIASVPYGVNGVTSPTSVRVLVVGGGGAGGSGGATATIGGGGGGGSVIEQVVNVTLGVALNVTVAAGAAGSVTNGVRSSFGNPSRFDGIVAIGGGSGGINDNNGSYAPLVRPGGHGANGGGRNGGGNEYIGLSMIPGGFNGGAGDGYNAGGGGGAGAVGSNNGPGGNGKVSTITGLTYAGGGGSGRQGSAGGTGGGGAGGASGVAAVAGTANTGGGGGGSFLASTATGTGGSGVVVIRCSAGLNIRLGVGLTYTISTISGDKLVTITAGTDTVTFF